MSLYPEGMQWGNPDITLLRWMAMGTKLSHLLAELRQQEPAGYDSLITKNELNETVGFLNNRTQLTVEEKKKFDFYYYNDVYAHLAQIFSIEAYPSFDRDFTEIKNMVYPLAIMLAMHFNRATPAQLGRHHRLKLFPQYPPLSTPSYPYPKYVLAMVASNVFANRVPERFEEVKKYIEAFKKSLYYQGNVLPSDVQYSWIVSETILHDKEFNRIFKI